MRLRFGGNREAVLADGLGSDRADGGDVDAVQDVAPGQRQEVLHRRRTGEGDPGGLFVESAFGDGSRHDVAVGIDDVDRGALQSQRLRDNVASDSCTGHQDDTAFERDIGEGFDDARLDTLFLAMPISWRGTLVQYAGRLHRPLSGKIEARIVDYVDRQVPVLARMFERRMRGYREIGYRIADSPGSASIDTSLDGGPAPTTEALT